MGIPRECMVRGQRVSQRDNRTRSCGEDLPAHFENGRLLLVSLNTDMMCANVIGMVRVRA